MSYIIKVIGYNAYWTGDTEPEKLWSTDMKNAKVFEIKEEAQYVVDAGNNMEVVESTSNSAFDENAKKLPNWDEVDAKLKTIKKEKIITIDNFKTSSNIVYDAEVIE